MTAIGRANAGSGEILDLSARCVYTFKVPDNGVDAPGTALPVITAAMTIEGNGATLTRNAAAPFRVLDVGPSGALTLVNATVSNGNPALWAGGPVNSGGGILDNGGLVLEGDTITHNQGSGVYETPTAAALTAYRTTVSSNTVDGILNVGQQPIAINGGSVANNAWDGVGSDGDITVDGVVISGNSNGVHTLGRAAPNGITVTNTAFDANAEIQILSGGAASISNSTVSGRALSGVQASGGLSMDRDTVTGFTGTGVIAGDADGGVTTIAHVAMTAGSGSSLIESGGASGAMTVVADSDFTSMGVVAGGIGATGPLTVARSSLNGFGTGVSSMGPVTVDSSSLIGQGGTGISSERSVTINDSMVSAFDTGIRAGSGVSTVAGSYIVGNRNEGIAGGGYNGPLLVTRSTIVRNREGVVSPTTITDSTFAQNSFDAVDADYPATVTNTVFDANGSSDGSGRSNCFGSVVDGGRNVVFPASDTSCPTTFVRADPRLDATADNGGPTFTMAMPDGSAAAGLVPVGAPGCTAADVDQRGVPRLQNGQPCDAGAFERDSTSTSIHVTAPALTVTVTPISTIPGAPSGTVDLLEGSELVATVPLTHGTASLSAMALGVGTHTLVARFLGATGYGASVSAPLTVVIPAPPLSTQAAAVPVPNAGGSPGLPGPALVVLGMAAVTTARRMAVSRREPCSRPRREGPRRSRRRR